MGGDGVTAVMVNDMGTESLYYTYKDFQGTIMSLTDQAGTVVYEQNFDAWGRGRDVSSWDYPTTVMPTAFDWLRGYTGHEHLTQYDLINMNGRLYDPSLGRMLSPDNFVQSPTSTQSHNRYSYVFNNPLKYTDPSGQIAAPSSAVQGTSSVGLSSMGRSYYYIDGVIPVSSGFSDGFYSSIALSTGGASFTGSTNSWNGFTGESTGNISPYKGALRRKSLFNEITASNYPLGHQLGRASEILFVLQNDWSFKVPITNGEFNRLKYAYDATGSALKELTKISEFYGNSKRNEFNRILNIVLEKLGPIEKPSGIYSVTKTFTIAVPIGGFYEEGYIFDFDNLIIGKYIEYGTSTGADIGGGGIIKKYTPVEGLGRDLIFDDIAGYGSSSDGSLFFGQYSWGGDSWTGSFWPSGFSDSHFTYTVEGVGVTFGTSSAIGFTQNQGYTTITTIFP